MTGYVENFSNLVVVNSTITHCASALLRIGTLLQFKINRAERLLETRDNIDRLNWIDDSLSLLFSQIFS